MTEKARRQDGDEAREERERLPAEMSHELAPERDAQRDLTGATTSDSDGVPAPDAESAGATERVRPRRAPRKAATVQPSATDAAIDDATSDATSDATTEAPIEATGVVAMSAIEADRIELEAQGFTADEADRLIEVSKRLESSAEARASQAELKRLRFAQWLIERGILDEFSA